MVVVAVVVIVVVVCYRFSIVLCVIHDVTVKWSKEAVPAAATTKKMLLGLQL